MITLARLDVEKEGVGKFAICSGNHKAVTVTLDFLPAVLAGRTLQAQLDRLRESKLAVTSSEEPVDS